MNTVYHEQQNVKLYCNSAKKLEDVSHFHSELEMVVCFSGKVNCFLNGRNFNLGEGDIVLVFPNQVHNYKMLEDGEFLILKFYPEMLPNMKGFFKSYLPGRTKLNFSESDDFKELTYHFRKRYDAEQDNSASLLIGYLNMAMFYIKPMLAAEPVANISSGNFEKIRNYCIHNYRSKITLDILSKELHLSGQRISHIFNQNMRLTIPQYVNFLRVSEACQLLADTSDSVAKISADVGFESLRSFNRVFFEIMKMTPREFRDKRKKESDIFGVLA